MQFTNEMDYDRMEYMRKGNKTMINFNVPPYTGKEVEYMKEAIENQKICGDGPFTKK